jgi:hypothetical protein
MSAKSKVWALAVLVAALASGVTWEIIHRKDEPSRRPAAVASARIPGPLNPQSSPAPDASAGDGGGGGGDAPAPASAPAAPTPEVKQAIADEVKAQLAQQQAQAGQSGGSSASAAAPANASAGEVPPALDPARRTFVVTSDLSVVANGQECGLTAGDVITRLTDTPDADNMVNASVSASKKSDCAAGQTVAVKVDDLEEMQNHFAEKVNDGLSELAKKQGTNGMPKAPLSVDAMVQNAQAALAAGNPISPPDNSALYWARRARRINPQNHAAIQIEETILFGSIQLIQADRKAGRYERALGRLDTVQALYPDHRELAQLRSEILEEQSRRQRYAPR